MVPVTAVLLQKILGLKPKVLPLNIRRMGMGNCSERSQIALVPMKPLTIIKEKGENCRKKNFSRHPLDIHQTIVCFQPWYLSNIFSFLDWKSIHFRCFRRMRARVRVSVRINTFPSSSVIRSTSVTVKSVLPRCKLCLNLFETRGV